MGVGVGELNQIPMAGGLGDLIRDGTAGRSKEDQLLGTQMNHVKKGFETNSRITLKPKTSILALSTS